MAKNKDVYKYYWLCIFLVAINLMPAQVYSQGSLKAGIQKNLQNLQKYFTVQLAITPINLKVERQPMAKYLVKKNLPPPVTYYH